MPKYLYAQLESKFDAVRRANEWLNEHLTDLRTQVEVADRAVQKFTAEHNLTQAMGETVTTQQLSELNLQIIIAAAERAQKESNRRQIQDQLRAGGSTPPHRCWPRP
jgi:polysaccharide biosynthesis transport protein